MPFHVGYFSLHSLSHNSNNSKKNLLFLLELFKRVDMPEGKQGNQKVLIVAERYSTTSGGFIDSLRTTLKGLPAADCKVIHVKYAYNHIQVRPTYNI